MIFVVLHFTEKQKKWNSVFAIMDIPCNFQRNRPKEMAIGLYGLKWLGILSNSKNYTKPARVASGEFEKTWRRLDMRAPLPRSDSLQNGPRWPAEDPSSTYPTNVPSF
jgi:hypothetical protein